MIEESILLALAPSLKTAHSAPENDFDGALLRALGRLYSEKGDDAALAAVVEHADSLQSDQIAREPAGQAVALTVAVCRICATSKHSDGNLFWMRLSASVLSQAIKLIDRSVPGGYQLCRSALQRFASQSSLVTRRRDALVLHRLNRGDYWAAHFYVSAISNIHHRFAAVRVLLKKYPDHIGNIGALISATDSAASVPPEIRVCFLRALKRTPEGGSFGEWQAIFVARVLERLDDIPWAYKIISGGYRTASIDLIRFEGLILMARLAGRLFGRLAELRCMVTALRVMPDHVSAPTIMNSIAELVRGLPDLKESENINDFAAGNIDVLRLDAQVDIGPRLQYWLQIPEFLTQAEIVVGPLGGVTRAERHQTMVIPETEITVFKLPAPRHMSGSEDMWKMACDLPLANHRRRRLLSFECRDVYLKVSGNYTLVYSKQGELLPQVSSGHGSFFQADKVVSSETQYLCGEHFSLCVPFGHSNYSHFLLDRLPRLLFAKDWRSGMTILVDADSAEWTTQILRAAGSRARVVPIALDRVYRLEHATLFSKAQHPLQMGFPGYIEFLRQFIPAWDALRPFRRIVIHRDRGRRGIVNEDEFYKYMQRRGFEIIRLELLSITEQLQLFAEAEFAVAVHGAGLSNVVACKPGSTVIEILPTGYFTPAFAILCRAAGLRYLPYLEVSETNTRLATDGQYSDTYVSLARWDQVLNRAVAGAVLSTC